MSSSGSIRGEPWNPVFETCDFKCLQCKHTKGGCLYDDPDYPLPELFDPIITEDYWVGWEPKVKRGKPKDPLKQYCPRCYSTRIKMTYDTATCKRCGFTEGLIDFPCNLY